jgi:hypothetical protein
MIATTRFCQQGSDPLTCSPDVGRERLERLQLEDLGRLLQERICTLEGATTCRLMGVDKVSGDVLNSWTTRVRVARARPYTHGCASVGCDLSTHILTGALLAWVNELAAGSGYRSTLSALLWTSGGHPLWKSRSCKAAATSLVKGGLPTIRSTSQGTPVRCSRA